MFIPRPQGQTDPVSRGPIVQFRRCQSGAVTSEFVVLGGFVIMLALSIVSSVGSGSAKGTTNINSGVASVGQGMAQDAGLDEDTYVTASTSSSVVDLPYSSGTSGSGGDGGGTGGTGDDSSSGLSPSGGSDDGGSDAGTGGTSGSAGSADSGSSAATNDSSDSGSTTDADSTASGDTGSTGGDSGSGGGAGGGWSTGCGDDTGTAPVDPAADPTTCTGDV